MPVNPASDTPATAAPAPAADGGAVQPRFEEAFARLEEIVGEMERGELALEDLLTRFEEGVGLVRRCNEFLQGAQLRVEQFVEQKDGQWVLKPLDE